MTEIQILHIYIKELQKMLSKEKIDKAIINLQKEVENVWETK